MFRAMDIFSSVTGSRDRIFEKILSEFSGAIRIAQVGAIQSFRKDHRLGSGWSEVFFLNYLKTHPGSTLTVVDVDSEALENSRQVASEILGNSCPGKVRWKAMDGGLFLKRENDFDLVYLDGSDCPKEMLAQFEYLDRSKTCILCDDWKIKGTLVAAKNTDFEHFNVCNEMAYFRKVQK